MCTCYYLSEADNWISFLRINKVLLYCIVFGWLVGWMSGLLVGWLVGWLIGWLLGCLVAWLVGWLVGWLAGWLVGWLVSCLVAWLVSWLVCWLVGWFGPLGGWEDVWSLFVVANWYSRKDPLDCSSPRTFETSASPGLPTPPLARVRPVWALRLVYPSWLLSLTPWAQSIAKFACLLRCLSCVHRDYNQCYHTQHLSLLPNLDVCVLRRLFVYMNTCRAPCLERYALSASQWQLKRCSLLLSRPTAL